MASIIHKLKGYIGGGVTWEYFRETEQQNPIQKKLRFWPAPKRESEKEKMKSLIFFS